MIGGKPYVRVDKYISPGAAAALLNISVNIIRRWCNQGKLTAFLTPSGQRKVLYSDILAILPQNNDIMTVMEWGVLFYHFTLQNRILFGFSPLKQNIIWFKGGQTEYYLVWGNKSALRFMCWLLIR